MSARSSRESGQHPGDPFEARDRQCRQWYLPDEDTPAGSARRLASPSTVKPWLEYYGASASLARSIYGKRAASSFIAAAATVGRRATALKGPAAGRSDTAAPEEFTDIDGDLSLAVEDDEVWQRAETAIVDAKSKDRKAELTAIQGVLGALERAMNAGPSSKWRSCRDLLIKHGIRPGEGQLLVFTEFADTAHWLAGEFSEAGYTTDILEGSVSHRDRDTLQQRFLDGHFQVLVSTDAGGEGIDLQSAHVMIDWDIPWSLVRLEQRMGRLHRIGQKKPVHIYHLVAPQTREGRVQEVMLKNLEAAGGALGGRIFDLLDATAARAGFDYTRALMDAQKSPTAVIAVPDVTELTAVARALVADEDRLHTPTNTEAALARFRSDRLEAINPVIVDAFLDQLARSQRWSLGPGPAKGIRSVSSRGHLPPALGGGNERFVAADGASVRQAINDGSQGLEDVVILGPTEEPFAELVKLALRTGEADLIRGTRLTDAASLTSYSLLLYDSEVETHDGLRRSRRKTPLLIRFSGAGAFETGWQSLINLRVSEPNSSPTPGLPPAVRSEGLAAAAEALQQEMARMQGERSAWVAKARQQLDQVEYRYLEELDELTMTIRRERRAEFTALKDERLRQLSQMEKVTPTAPRLIGWAQVSGGALATDMGYDPDSEAVAIATVLAELERLNFAVDDRQTAEVGYDLLARHKVTGEQRLIEVKGFQAGLAPVWLEQHEWAQAQQRGKDYWLYVVAQCALAPTTLIRAQDPAGQLKSGPRRIERYQIKLGDLKRLMGP